MFSIQLKTSRQEKKMMKKRRRRRIRRRRRRGKGRRGKIQLVTTREESQWLTTQLIIN